MAASFFSSKTQGKTENFEEKINEKQKTFEEELAERNEKIKNELALLNYREKPMARCKSELLQLRKAENLKVSNFFADNKHSLPSTRLKMREELQHCSISFAENPYHTRKSLQKKQDIENLAKNFIEHKHGIHKNSLPQYFDSLSHTDFARSHKTQLKPFRSFHVLAKNPVLPETHFPGSQDWDCFNNTADIVELQEIRRKAKNMQMNFKATKELQYSVFFARINKRKATKENQIKKIKRHRTFFMENRVNTVYQPEIKLKNQCLLRTTGFLVN